MTPVRTHPRDGLLAAGLANQQQRHFAEAEKCYRLVLAQAPHDAEALYRMGVLALQCANARAAVHFLTRAAERRAPDADGWYNLGMAHVLDYAFEHARDAFERALQHDAQHASAAVAIGNVHKFLGAADASARAYLAAAASPRIDPVLYSQVLVSLHANPDIDAETLFALHREWAMRYAAPVYPVRPAFKNSPDPGRRLSIGFVSPNFTATIVGHFLRGVLPALGQHADVLLYHAGRETDWVTDELRHACTCFRSIAEASDDEAAQAVRADAVDVLVDLAGHAPGHRLLLFARRPAPVQVSWLDYFDTTGIATMDVLVSDPVSTPSALLDSGLQRFVETVAWLPHARLCYVPPPYLPDVAPAPSRVAGSITFGCFGRADKITPAVIALWSRVLSAIPTAKLILKSAGFEISPVRERVLQSFATGGIARERITLRAPGPHAAMLAEYADVDIALDTFPYNGGATTCDALCMGVPVITLAGTSLIARQGAALLAAAQCPQWIAHDQEAYLRIARDLAAGPEELAKLRPILRRRVLASPLCDGEAFARDLLAVLRAAWAAWCRRATNPTGLPGGGAVAHAGAQR